MCVCVFIVNDLGVTVGTQCSFLVDSMFQTIEALEKGLVWRHGGLLSALLSVPSRSALQLPKVLFV